jgi:uncharacterized Tic20 family protein
MLAILAHLTPVTALLAIARGDSFARAHGVAALRFQLSLAVYLAAIVGVLELLRGTVVAVQFVPFLLFLNLVLVVNAVLFAIVAIRRAATGRTFTYPMTIGRT